MKGTAVQNRITERSQDGRVVQSALRIRLHAPFKPEWKIYAPYAATAGVSLLHARTHAHTHTHNVFMCFVWISEQSAIISLYSIN
jgi:hypothetical protein